MAGGGKRDAVRWSERLKESSLRSRLHRLSESPLPAVLLVDDHVHFPGSVFGDRPMRHQQTVTCRDGGMQKLIITQSDMYARTPAQLSGLFTKGDS